jgi:hypothetical protein
MSGKFSTVSTPWNFFLPVRQRFLKSSLTAHPLGLTAGTVVLAVTGGADRGSSPHSGHRIIDQWPVLVALTPNAKATNNGMTPKTRQLNISARVKTNQDFFVVVGSVALPPHQKRTQCFEPLSNC